MGIIERAIAWADSIANDDSHGYDQTNRWGPDYDCSSLLITAYENAGVPVKTNGASFTGNMVSVFINCGFTDVTPSITLSTGAGLKPGDVLWKSGHVEMVEYNGNIVGASINENGETTGGVTGDQTGKEIRIRSYYNGPWETVLRYVEPEESAEWITGNRRLTTAEMQHNARLFYNYFKARGWSINAICAMLGNIETESYINPGVWQSYNPYAGGYGLVQWTPYTKYANWCGSGWENNGNKQCERIIWERDNGEQWYYNNNAPIVNPPITFAEFSVSNLPVETLANYFLWYYEQPKVTIQPDRASQALAWYDYLIGLPDIPIIPIKRKMPLWMMLRNKNRMRGIRYGY